MKMHWFVIHVMTLAGCFVGLSALAAAPGQKLEIRMATILPRGLGQDLVLTRLEQDWNKATGGTVTLRRAPGGQKDGEATIVRKLHSGNYQAALLSVIGLSEIEPDTGALQNMPLAFQNWDEVDYIREKISARLEQQLEKKGFVVLFWADSGWVNFFSVRKATTPAEFKRMKLFAWAGQEAQITIMKSLGYQPIALETDNIHSGFATGMLEAAPIAPTFAIGVQIPTVAPHVLDINWAPIVGAAIMRKETWAKIPAELQPKLRELCAAAGKDLRAEGRRFHEGALNTLRKGPRTQVHEPTVEEREAWQKLALDLAPKVRGQLVPAGIFDEVQQALAEFRTTKGK